jgi:hypothetical protein
MDIRTRYSLSVVLAGALAASWSCGGKTPTEATVPQASAPVATAPGGEGDDGTVDAAVGFSDMRWTLADRCADGKGVQMRIFTRTGVEQKTFPETGGTFKVQSGRRISKVIRCRTGQKECPGLTTMPQTDRSWGVGINGDKRCTNCCKFCAPKEIYLETSCPKGSSILISALDGSDAAGLSFLDGDAVDSE